MPKKHETMACLHCGAEINSRATACPVCGSDELTGWSEDTYLDGIDAGDEVDYDELVENEFGPKARGTTRKKKVSWRMIVGAILLLLAALYLLKDVW